MDMNQNKLMNHPWDAEMSMEDHHQHQIFHHHHHHHHDPSPTFINSPPPPPPPPSLWPSFDFPLHQVNNNSQIPSAPSSSQIIIQPNPSSSTLLFGADQHPLEPSSNIIIDHEEQREDEEPEEELGAMKEMMYRIAAMQPVDIDPTTIRKPKRRNIRISDDPQSVAARHRRERISEKIRILQRLVPGGTKMDTASMLDEAIRYVKFLKRQIRLLQSDQCIGSGHHFNSNDNKFPLSNDITATITGTAVASASCDALNPVLGHGFPLKR